MLDTPLANHIRNCELIDLFSEWVFEIDNRGIIITDDQLQIREWNSWLVFEAGLPEETVVGCHLFTMFPDLIERNLDSYYYQALEGKVSLLSQSFHKYLIPIRNTGGDDYMMQSVRIVPLINDDKVVGTATIIEDVTERVQRQRAMMQEVEVNAALAALSRELITSNDMTEISAMVLKYSKILTGSKFGYVGNIDSTTGYLVSTAHSGAEINSCNVLEKDILFKEFNGLCGWVLKNRKSVLTNDAVNEPRSSGVPQGHMPIHKFLSVPVMQGDALLGQIALANPERNYTQKDQEVIERLATLYALSISRNQLETSRNRTLAELREALANIRMLKEILPICMFCKKIRDDEGYWDQLDAYIIKHTDSELSHSICPDCFRVHYGDDMADKAEKQLNYKSGSSS